MKGRVLICDDSLLMRRMVRDALADDGWECVAEAANGQQAIDLYRELRPDAVTMDMVMPEADGLHGLRGIRELDPQAKVIMVSAVNQTKLVTQAIRDGAHDFIAKPFLPEQLQQTLANCIAP